MQSCKQWKQSSSWRDRAGKISKLAEMYFLRGQCETVWVRTPSSVRSAFLTLGTDLLPHSAGDKCWNDNVAVAAVVFSDPELFSSSSSCSCTFFLPNAPARSSVRKSNWGWTRVLLGGSERERESKRLSFLVVGQRRQSRYHAGHLCRGL